MSATRTEPAGGRRTFFGEKGVFWTVVVPVLLTIWLYPPFARHWQDLPKEKEFKSQLVITVTDAMTGALSTGRLLVGDLLPQTQQLDRDFGLIGKTRSFVQLGLEEVSRSHPESQRVARHLHRIDADLETLLSPDELSSYELTRILEDASNRADRVLRAHAVDEPLADPPTLGRLRFVSDALQALSSSFPERLETAQLEEADRFTPARIALLETNAQVLATVKTYYAPHVHEQAREILEGTFSYLRLSARLNEESRGEELDTLRSLLGADAVSWERLEQAPGGPGYYEEYEDVRELLEKQMTQLVEILVEEDTTVFTVGTCDVVLDLIPVLQRDHLNSSPAWLCGRS